MALLALAAAWANAQTGDWGDVTIVSGTVGNNSNRLCMGVPDYMRPADIGCPSYAPSLSTAGHVSITGNVSANRFIGDGSGLSNLSVSGDRIVSDTHAVIVHEGTGYVSLTTTGSTWGYLSSGWSYLANLFTNSVSSSLVSATNVSATYVDVTRNGTVSGTYGYFRYISGTDIHGRFTGDGSGLSGVVAGSSDRIVSGSTGGTRMVAISQTGYISITQAGANAGWFDPYRGLVTLGVSTTGPISGTAGYFSGNVGVGAAPDGGRLHVYSASGTPNIRVQSGGGVIDLATDGTSGYLTNYINNGIFAYTASGPGGLHSFYVSGSERARIGADGVAIGTGSFSSSLTVAGEAQVGNSGAACVTAANAGAIRYSGGTLYYCNASNTWAALGTSTGVTGTGSATAVAYWSGASGLTYDSDGFYWNAANNRLGIGTNTPAYAVDISGSAAAVRFNARNYNSGGSADNNFINDAGALVGVQMNGSTMTGTSFSASKANMARIISVGASSLAVGTFESNPLVLGTADTERMRITPAGNVGISMQSPTATLQVSGTFTVSNTGQGASSPSLYVASAGQVGVGTSSPSAPLHVVRNDSNNLVASFEGVANANAYLNFKNSYSSPNGAGFTFSTSASTLGFFRYHFTSGYQFYVGGGAASNLKMSIQPDGNVGISTSTPFAKLDVAGTISASDAIQVGSSSLACSNGIPGAIRYHAGSLQYCNGTSWTTLGASGGGQEDRIVSGSTNAIAWQDRSLTINTAGTQRMIVGESGNVGIGVDEPSPSNMLHVVGGSIRVRNNGGDGNALVIDERGTGFGAQIAWLNSASTKVVAITKRPEQGLAFYTNGIVSSGYERMVISPSGNVGISTTYPKAKLDVVGTISASDAIQVGQSSLVCANPISGSIRYSAASSTIQVCNGTAWVGLGSGGGVSLATLTDVNITNLAGRDYLRYDFATSKWVNISESTVMSTTTMMNGWPDAIHCSYSNGEMFLPLAYKYVPSTEVYYSIQTGGSTFSIIFNASTQAYKSQGNMTGSDCLTKSISQLYAEGKAFNFIGNSGASGGNALGDRITSGTLAMVANSATSYVSLSSNGTTWGYLNSGNSFLPTLSANRVSATNVSASVVQLRGATVSAAGALANYIVSGTARVSVSSAGVLSFANGGTLQMVVDGNGNLGIGSSSTLPFGGSKQIVGGFGATGVGGVTNWNDTSNARSGNGVTLLLGSATNGPGGNYYYHPFSFEYSSKDGTGNMTQLAVAYGESTSAYTNGGLFMRSRYVGSWTGWYKFTTTAVSDYRAKEHVTSLTGGLEKVMALKPIHFDYKEGLGTTGPQDGFYAHELANVAPYAVTGAKDQVDDSGNPQYQSIDLARLTPLLASAIQQLKHDNDNQQAKIIRLEEVVQELRGAVDQLRRDLRDSKQAKHK